MTTEQIHSCSYYCHIPACIKAQRDELRDKQAAQINLYHKVNLLMLEFGKHGSLTTDHDVVLDVMDALYEIDGGVYDSKRA